MTVREHLLQAAKHLWAVYEIAPSIGGLSTLTAIRSQLDSVLSKLENVDDLADPDA